MTDLLKYVTDSQENNALYVDLIFFDLSDAFDIISHEILISKLIKIGFGSDLLITIKNAVTYRSQYVKIGDTKSELMKINSGVPQGSHCSGLLFALYIDNITDSIKYSKIHKFADDIVMVKATYAPIVCENLQTDINSVQK